MNNFIIAIVSCEKYIHTRVPHSISLVGDMPHAVFTGRHSNTSINVSHIPLDCGDDYSSLRGKTIELFKWFLRTNFDFLVKVDDDCYFDITKIKSLPNIDYGGVLSDFTRLIANANYHLEYIHKIPTSEGQNLNYIKNMKFDFQYAAGGCYIISRDTVSAIIEHISHTEIPQITQEDVTIGYICDQLGVSATDFTIQEPWYDMTTFSIHPCNSALIRSLRNTKTLQERINLCRTLLPFNTYYRKYFNLNCQLSV